jgi:hypothetical protein
VFLAFKPNQHRRYQTNQHKNLLPQTTSFLHNNSGFSGIVTFVYAASDAVNPTPTNATVTLTVAPQPLAASNATYVAAFGANLTVTDLVNTTDAAAGKALASVAQQPSGGAGAVELAPPAGFTFAPALGWSGERQCGVAVLISLLCNASLFCGIQSPHHP